MPDLKIENRRSFFRLAAMTAAVPLFAGTEMEDQGRMPELDGAVGWINSAPLSRKALLGKVVLFNFWTYSCINSLRELPYMKAWTAKYKDAGLIVVGVHTPEFGFEKDRDRVRTAVDDLRVTYPVPIDSHRSIWQAFGNQYWPANYFVDAKGRIRHHHFGEGEYVKSERVIQALLKEKGAGGWDDGVVKIVAAGAEAPPSAYIQSPETYAGYSRTENFASPERMERDTSSIYNLPDRLTINQWALGGSWDVGAESARLESAPGRLAFRFHSRDFHMVVGPAKRGTSARFKLKLNGVAPGEDHGSDAGADGTGAVRQARMYQLIRQKGPIFDSTVEIEFLDAGVEVFSFTFG